MRIALVIEGDTERVLLPYLQTFLQSVLKEKGMPRLDPVPQGGRIPTGDKLKRVVERLFNDGSRSADAVIALTDVYPDFTDAVDAKEKLRQWVGMQPPRFYPHVALHDFEAWLLPFWTEIQMLAGSNRSVPGTHPEQVNRTKPPAHWIEEVFRTGNRGRHYVKPRDAGRILRGQDLLVSARACPELKSFLNTIIELCGGNRIP